MVFIIDVARLIAFLLCLYLSSSEGHKNSHREFLAKQLYKSILKEECFCDIINFNIMKVNKGGENNVQIQNDDSNAQGS